MAHDIAYSYDEVGNRTQKLLGSVRVAYSLPYGSSGNRLTGWAATSTNTFTDDLSLNVSGYLTESIGTNAALGQLWVSNGIAQVPGVEGTNFTAEALRLSPGAQSIVSAIGDVAGNTDYATNSVTMYAITNASYNYSVAGCLTSMVYIGTGCTQTMSLAWNQQYKLTSVSTNGAVAQGYAYDALGRRTRIVTGATTNHLVYDGIHVAAEVDASGILKWSYTYGPGIDNILAMTDHETGSTYYFLTDHIGTVHGVVDGTGSIVESYTYDAWGRVLGVYDGDGVPLEESAIGNRFLFQGREYSWETGLYYFRARWYDPITGRWLSKDPIGISGGLNQYVAFNNNPVNFVDPDGLVSRWQIIVAHGLELLADLMGGPPTPPTPPTTTPLPVPPGIHAPAIPGAAAGGAAAGGTAAGTFGLAGAGSTLGAGTIAGLGAASGAVGGAIGYGLGRVPVGQGNVSPGMPANVHGWLGDRIYDWFWPKPEPVSPSPYDDPCK